MRPPERRAGFSLVELLVALVVTGIVGGAIVQVLLDQHLFYGTIDDRTFTEQTVRAASDLLYRELRSTAPEDLVSAGSDGFTIRQDSVRATVCSSGGGEVAAYVYHLVPSPGLESGTAATFYRDVQAETYDYLADPPTLLYTGTDGPNPEQSCTDAGAPTGAPADRYVQWDWPGTSTPGAGTAVHVIGEVTYSLEGSDFGDGTALWRNGRRELIGPLGSESTFVYRLDDGTETSSPGTLADVRAVIFEGRVREPNRSRDEASRELRLDVTLRNNASGAP